LKFSVLPVLPFLKKSVFLQSLPLGKKLKKVIRQQDEDGKTPFSFLERATRKEVRRIEKIDEEELGLGNLETERLDIITAIEGISQKQYSQQVLEQNTLQGKDQLKATRTYYTDGSIRDNMVGFGVYCE
jgi:hypothetical protein